MSIDAVRRLPLAVLIHLRPVLLANGFGLHHGDADRLVGTGLHTGRGFSLGEALVAHVAFADDAAGAGIPRHFVGTHEDAILAADALVIQVADDAGERILVIGQHRAAVGASGIGTMMAGGGDRLEMRLGPRAADQEADAAPGLVLVQAVEGVAGGGARRAHRAPVPGVVHRLWRTPAA